MRSRPGDIFLLETVVICVHGSQEFEVDFHAEGAKSQAEEMVGAHKGL